MHAVYIMVAKNGLKNNSMKKDKTGPKAPPQLTNEKHPGFQIPPGAIPLCYIFAVREGGQERIGIIMNEQVDPMQIKFALENANKIAGERAAQLPQAAQQQSGPQQQRHPKLTELLWE